MCFSWTKFEAKYLPTQCLAVIMVPNPAPKCFERRRNPPAGPSQAFARLWQTLLQVKGLGRRARLPTVLLVSCFLSLGCAVPVGSHCMCEADVP